MDGRNFRHQLLGRGNLPMLAIPLLIGLLLGWQHYENERATHSLYFTGFIGFFLCYVMTLLMARDRCGELELSLPISGKVIWKHNVAFTLLVSMGHVALFVLPIAVIGNAWARDLFLSLGGHILAGLILTGSLVHQVNPNRNRLDLAGPITGMAFTGLVAVVALVFLQSSWISMAAVVIAGVLLLRASGKVRESMTLTDDHSGPRGGYKTLGRWDVAAAGSEPATPVVLRAPARAGRLLTTLWMLGTINLGQYSLAARVFGFFILFSLGGALISPDAGLSMVAISLLATLIILHVLSPETVRTGSPYAHLPIPRRRLHAALMLPVIATIGFGGVLQGALKWKVGPNPGLVRVTDSRISQEPSYSIHIPPRYYEIAWDGQPPAVTGSNEETHVPSEFLANSVRMSRGGPALYNPYYFSDNPSLEFITEQYQRAVKNIYGLDLEREQAITLITRHRGRLDDVEGLTPTREPQLIAIGVFIFCTIWAMLASALALVTRLAGPARIERWSRSLRAQAVSFPALSVIGVFVILKSPTFSGHWLYFYFTLFTNSLSTLFTETVALAAALACLVAVYLLSQELFARREVSPGKAEV